MKYAQMSDDLEELRKFVVMLRRRIGEARDQLLVLEAQLKAVEEKIDRLSRSGGTL